MAKGNGLAAPTATGWPAVRSVRQSGGYAGVAAIFSVPLLRSLSGSLATARPRRPRRRANKGQGSLRD